MKRRELICGAAGAAASGLAGLALPALAQGALKSEYRMSSVLPPAFAWGRAAETWARLMREGGQGRMNVKAYPGASLVQGDATRELTALRQGAIDLVCGSPSNWSGTARELGCFSLPFLFPDHKALDAVLNNSAFVSQYFDAVRRAGLEPLALGETGFRQLSNSKRPVHSPADLKGMKLRLPPSPMMSDTFQELGANPTVMSWADAQPALASGAVDGCENPMELFFASKMNMLGQKYVTKWNYMNEVLLFAVSRSTWEGLGKDERALLRDSAQAAAKAQIAEVRKFFAEDLRQAAAVNVAVYEPTPAQLQEFTVSTRRSYARWKAQISPTLVGAIEQIVQNSRKA
ncbi:DctP family TRAP transporter solute-binding subunit [Ramlibacter monticola]|uniref:TRAP transporter substrate-binding protein DctP n=1 Tax=Ramlibacter monticola TaxID=1926872 RepID=A0A936YXS9_9BURK|nr:TRAP transporter substrate-binding protein DctP [Ramlibacter monticola]MBL0390056.1 TRAP transporter substrate-binding protein DctP [Ramlibacter monticola]